MLWRRGIRALNAPTLFHRGQIRVHVAEHVQLLGDDLLGEYCANGAPHVVDGIMDRLRESTLPIIVGENRNQFVRHSSRE
jgi:hypothetical protein